MISQLKWHLTRWKAKIPFPAEAMLSLNLIYLGNDSEVYSVAYLSPLKHETYVNIT
jgi:hypothetical protein